MSRVKGDGAGRSAEDVAEAEDEEVGRAEKALEGCNIANSIQTADEIGVRGQVRSRTPYRVSVAFGCSKDVRMVERNREPDDA